MTEKGEEPREGVQDGPRSWFSTYSTSISDVWYGGECGREAKTPSDSGALVDLTVGVGLPALEFATDAMGRGPRTVKPATEDGRDAVIDSLFRSGLLLMLAGVDEEGESEGERKDSNSFSDRLAVSSRSCAGGPADRSAAGRQSGESVRRAAAAGAAAVRPAGVAERLLKALEVSKREMGPASKSMSRGRSCISDCDWGEIRA